MWTVYKHTSPSGKVYIGITKLNPLRRWGKHGLNYKDNTYFKHAILKYGWDNFTHELLYTDLPEAEAKLKEIELIAYYKALGICYNISKGGDGNSKPVSLETRQKISKALKGRLSYFRDDNWRKQLSTFMKKHPTFNDVVRDKAHLKCKDILSKLVLQLDLNGNVIATYSGLREIMKLLNYDASYISKCCQGKKPQAYGYKWLFVNTGTKEYIKTH